MFYELHHSVGVDHFSVEAGENFSFPPHIHHSFELITLTSGSMKVIVGGREYILTPDKGILVFPNQIHALTTFRKSRHRLCIFSPKLVNSFIGSRQGLLPVDPLFDLPSDIADLLFALSPDDNRNLIKGALYTVCGLFDRNAVYEAAGKDGDDSLLFEIFSFIERHYADDCSLNALAAELSYSYAYLSKYFTRTVGRSYNSYVNQYRIGEVCNRLDNTDDSILKISEDCGFRSLRSMNRNFKEQTGVTPVEYRKRENPTAS
ncbi:MAG: helix-turn-helix transcriptional regulator [Clostridia bacterium]|nr:helix-turn-helix transcriptional regulator [Clostridia bacterium]